MSNQVLQGRPSLDSVYNLLQGLDDNQAEDLLRDLNHTAPSNVAVAEALDFFEGPEYASTSSRATRRRTAFLKSVSNFDLRSRMTSGGDSAAEPEPPLPTPRARSASAVHDEEEAEQQRNRQPQYKTPRAYKRISRPWATLAPSASGGPDVRDLLTAYLSDAPPPSSPSSSSSSFTSLSAASTPATPRSPASASSLFCPVIAPMECELDDSPGLSDLLEPSPLRPKPRHMAPGRSLAPQPSIENISGIFDVLSGRS